MAVEVVCPTCSTRYRVSEEQLSKASKLRCKQCNMVFALRESVEPELPSQQPETPPVKNKAAQFSADFGQPSQDLFAPQKQQMPPKDAEVSETPKDFSSELNLGEMALDFGVSAEALPSEPKAKSSFFDLDLSFTPGAPDTGEATPEMDFSFSAHIPEAVEGEEEEEFAEQDLAEAEIHDHIQQDFQDTQVLPDTEGTEIPPEQLSAPISEEATMTMDSGLNFSFNAHIPGGEGEEAAAGTAEAPTESAAISSPGLSLDGLGFEEPVVSEGTPPLPGAQVSEPLPGEDDESLQEELFQGEAHIGFSEMRGIEGGIVAPTEEDFSDVERALDALADGSFEKVMKKREAQKARAQKMKMLGIGVVGGIVLVLGALLLTLPSSHEKFVARYEKLASQEDMNPYGVVALFLDAAREKDTDIVNRISVLPEMPDIARGEILRVGDEEAAQSIGSPGKDIKRLQAEIAELEKTITAKNASLQKYLSKNLSPKVIQETIKSLQKKQTALQAEFDGKEAESARTLIRLENELVETERELRENEAISRQYMDATDKIGKALYQNSLIKKQLLADTKGKLEDHIKQEEIAHNKRMDVITAEYEPRFAELRQKLDVQQALYKEAKLLQDQEKSPVILLSEELERLTKTMVEKKNLKETKEQQLKTALTFFKRREQQQQVMKVQNTAEFVFVSRNVMTSLKFQGASKQNIPITLTRYRAIIGKETIQGDWIVEKILR